MTTTRPGFLSALGWRWVVLPGSKVAHLIPVKLGERSRSACGFVVVGRDIPEQTTIADPAHCLRCENRDA